MVGLDDAKDAVDEAAHVVADKIGQAADKVAGAMTAPPTVVTKSVSFDQPSDLPESNWLWRRVFIFAFTGSVLCFDWQVIAKAKDEATLRLLAELNCGLAALAIMLYIAGASSENIVRLVGAIKTTRKETVTEGPAPPPSTA